MSRFLAGLCSIPEGMADASIGGFAAPLGCGERDHLDGVTRSNNLARPGL